MKDYLVALEQASLFKGMCADEIGKIISCFDGKFIHYAENEVIIQEGEVVNKFGILIKGRCQSIKTDAFGKQAIIVLITPGGEMGVLLAADSPRESSVVVKASQESIVLEIAYEKILEPCTQACSRHSLFLRNYIHIVAQKGLELHERISCLLKQSLREKIIAYLEHASSVDRGSVFVIPFNRSEMAEYLNAERSALSRELSAMKREGMIDYHMNHFVLF